MRGITKLKNLILVRHAKSSWKDESLKDIDRPLNKRGKRDAPFMGKLLKKLGVKPQLMITSPAERTFATAKIFADELNYDIDKIEVKKSLYLADCEEMIEVINNINESYSVVLLFGHNPGLTDLSNVLSDEEIENIPTCGVVSFSLQHDKWNEIKAKSCTLNFLEFPKKYFL
jgi:phosphohistidine phosphatase